MTVSSPADKIHRMRERQINPRHHTVYETLRQFMHAPSHPSGVLTVMEGGVPIDIKHDPRGFDTTTVFFHAALSSKRYQFPVFTGGGISEDMPTNRILITDPSIYVSDEIRLGWYAGNHLQPRLQWVIRSILKRLIPMHHHVVTFGPSGGGFAALYFASKFEGATAVPVNPQTNIAMYLPTEVNRYLQHAWNLRDADRLNEVTAVTDLARIYRSGAPNRVFYMQNRLDQSHVERHFEPFMAMLPEDHEVYPVIIDGEPGHYPPPKENIAQVLRAAIEGKSSPPLFAAAG